MWNQSAAVSVLNPKPLPSNSVTSSPSTHQASHAISSFDNSLQPAKLVVSSNGIAIQMQPVVGASTNPTPRNQAEGTSRISRPRSENDKCSDCLVTRLIQVYSIAFSARKAS